MIGRSGAEVEQWGALRDTQNVCEEYGADVTFHLRDEGNITRDRYGSISREVSADTYTFRCWPVELAPSQQQVEAAGLLEAGEATIYSPKKSWDDRGVTFEDFDLTRMSVEYDGHTWEVVDKAKNDQFLGMYLYYTFSVKRR